MSFNSFARKIYSKSLESLSNCIDLFAPQKKWDSLHLPSRLSLCLPDHPSSWLPPYHCAKACKMQSHLTSHRVFLTNNIVLGCSFCLIFTNKFNSGSKSHSHRRMHSPDIACYEIHLYLHLPRKTASRKRRGILKEKKNAAAEFC